MSENTNNNQIPVGVSPGIFTYFKLNKLKYVDVFAELIDNSISSCLKRGVKPIIKITLQDDAIEIVDNGIGFSRQDLNTALIAADNTTTKSSYSELNVYGYGLKGSVFWLGNVLKISSISTIDRMRYHIEFDMRDLPKQLSPTPTVELKTFGLDNYQIEEAMTKITISEINSGNYNLDQRFIRELKTCLSRIYAPRLEKSELDLYINDELIHFLPRVYLEAHYFNCYTEIGNKKYELNKECQLKEQEIWAYNINESLTDPNSGKKYSITGRIGMKPSQSATDTGIRVYRRNRGILGCNSSLTDYNPFNLQQGKPSQLFLIGDIHLNDSFDKPLMGNDLPEMNILNELLKDVQRKNKRLFTQADKFRIAMLTPLIGGPTTPMPPQPPTSPIPPTMPTPPQSPISPIPPNTPTPPVIPYTAKRKVIQMVDTNLKIIFEEVNELKIKFQIVEDTKNVLIKCSPQIFESNVIIGTLINELVLSMDFSRFKDRIEYLNSLNE